jgi:hypothetical protein
MKNNVYRFRSLKHGDPEQKLKMIPSAGRTPRGWLLGVAAVVAFCGGFAAMAFWLK